VQKDPNEIYFVGGHKDGKSVNVIVKMDTNEMVYSIFAYMKKPRRNCRVHIWDNSLIVMGG